MNPTQRYKSISDMKTNFNQRFANLEMINATYIYVLPKFYSFTFEISHLGDSGRYPQKKKKGSRGRTMIDKDKPFKTFGTFC